MPSIANIPDLGDYTGWARRFAETCRQNGSDVAETVADVLEYAGAVREECAHETGRWGVDPNVVRRLSADATARVAYWRNEAARTFDSGIPFSEPQLEDFLVRMFQDVRTRQIRAAADEAASQADAAYQRDDAEQVTRWRNAEAALRALWADAEVGAILDPAAERSRWIELVSTFANEVANWARERNWRVAITHVKRSEELLGTYEVPTLIIQTERGAVRIEPVARVVKGALGRIDLYAYPTLFRVMLLRSPQHGEWRIRTDSGFFLRQSWNKETFLDLVQDLAAAA